MFEEGGNQMVVTANCQNESEFTLGKTSLFIPH